MARPCRCVGGALQLRALLVLRRADMNIVQVSANTGALLGVDPPALLGQGLDAVVTVVDAKHGMETLDTQEEAQKQVGFADRILVSKKDLVMMNERTGFTRCSARFTRTPWQ